MLFNVCCSFFFTACKVLFFTLQRQPFEAFSGPSLLRLLRVLLRGVHKFPAGMFVHVCFLFLFFRPPFVENSAKKQRSIAESLAAIV